MNILDYLLIAALGLFLFYGYKKGLLRLVLLFAGVVIGFVLAARFRSDLAEAEFLSRMAEQSKSVTSALCFLGIFFAVTAVTSVIVSVFARKMDASNLSSGNRWMGALMGLVIGVLLLGGLALGASQLDQEEGVGGRKLQAQVSESVLVPKLAEACLTLVALVPQAGRDELSKLYEEQVRTLHDPDSDASEPVPSTGKLDQDKTSRPVRALLTDEPKD